MTTAYGTLHNIRNATPIVMVFAKVNNEVNVSVTSGHFAQSNFRHLINRRVPLSQANQFIDLSISMLIAQVQGRAMNATRTSPDLEEARLTLTNLIQKTLTRRRSYNQASGEILLQVDNLIHAALDAAL